MCALIHGVLRECARATETAPINEKVKGKYIYILRLEGIGPHFITAHKEFHGTERPRRNAIHLPT